MGADLTAARPTGEISIGLRIIDPLDRPDRAHLSANCFPMKAKCCLGIGGDFRAFSAGAVSEEDKATFVQAFQQQYPHRRRAVCGSGRYGHGVGIVGLAHLGICHPSAKLNERIDESIHWFDGPSIAGNSSNNRKSATCFLSKNPNDGSLRAKNIVAFVPIRH